MNGVLVVGVVLTCGLALGKLVEHLGLPRVTGYILAGVLLNPHLVHLVPPEFPGHTSVGMSIALAFITFSVGGSLYWPRMKSLGRSILLITALESEFAFLAVTLGFLVATPLVLGGSGAGMRSVFLPVSILVGALAAPTDPSATLAVVHEYRARGPVSSTVLGVTALDDAAGIVNYSLAAAVAGAAVAHRAFGLAGSVGRPALIIAGSVALGAGFGVAFDRLSRFLQRETEGALIVLVIGLLGLCFGVASYFGLDELMATMVMGATVCNVSRHRRKIFGMLERYTEELVFVFFFTVSAMQLDVGVLRSTWPLVLVFVGMRMAGKYAGARTGAALARCPQAVRRYVAGGLIPQGGIVIGLSQMIRHQEAFRPFGDVVVSVVVGAAVIHEIVGPVLSRLSLRRLSAAFVFGLPAGRRAGADSCGRRPPAAPRAVTSQVPSVATSACTMGCNS